MTKQVSVKKAGVATGVGKKKTDVKTGVDQQNMLSKHVSVKNRYPNRCRSNK